MDAEFKSILQYDFFYIENEKCIKIIELGAVMKKKIIKLYTDFCIFNFTLSFKLNTTL